MMYKIYIPHIDKTGGQSLECMLMNAANRAGWTYDHNAGTEFPDPVPDNHMRLGMHQEYNPKYITEEWFTLLVIREPLERFISAYNFFHYEYWRNTGYRIQLCVEAFCELSEAKRRGDEVPREQGILRGYVSMIDALNAEQRSVGFRFTDHNIFDIFDVVIDTNRFNELPDIFEPLGLEVHNNLHVNWAGQHMPNQKILRIGELTSEDYGHIGRLHDFRRDVNLWNAYCANRK